MAHPKNSRALTILVLLGGHAQRLLPFLRMIYPELAYVLVIDSPDELDRLGFAAPGPNVQLFPIGMGETAQTLCADAPAELAEHIRCVGGMDAGGGMGQAIAVGHQAAKRLVDSPEFKGFIRSKILPELRARSRGAIDSIHVVLAGSLAGGTYSGGEIVIARGIVEQLLNLTSGTVVTDFLATGGLTYEGLGDRTWQNAAAAMAELLRYVTDSSRHPREVRRLRLLEFMVLRLDEPLRDAYLAQVEQAARCQWMTLFKKRCGPNDALNGCYGNVQTWEVAYGTPLDPANDVAAVAQVAYGDLIRQTLDREASVAAAERLEIEHQRIRLGNTAVDDVMAEAVDHAPPWSLVKLQSPSYCHQVTLAARKSANECIQLETFRSAWAIAPRTCAEIDARLQLQRRLLELLRNAASELAERRAALEDDLAGELERFEKYHRRLRPSGIYEVLAGAVTSTARKLAHLTDAAGIIRDLSDQLVLVNAEEAAIDQAATFVGTSFSYLSEKLARMLVRLDEAGPPLGNQAPLVLLAPLDDRLAELWMAVDEGPDSFLDALRRAVNYVTVAGLAKVCGAAAAEVGEIAKQIAFHRAYATPAVPWGGRRRADEGLGVHLLPPLEADLEKVVTDAVKAIQPGIVLAFVDKAPVVVNIVHVEMRLVRKLEDVLTEPYLLGLNEAINEPCNWLYFPNGVEGLRSLGIEHLPSTDNH